MTEYAIVDNGQVVGFREFDRMPGPLPGKPYRKILPVVDSAPAYDPDTQVKEGPVVTVEAAHQVTRAWSVRDKTAEELDATKEAKLSALDMVQFRVLFNHENRMRALEGKPEITLAQFRNALKALL